MRARKRLISPQRCTDYDCSVELFLHYVFFSVFKSVFMNVMPMIEFRMAIGNDRWKKGTYVDGLAKLASRRLPILAWLPKYNSEKCLSDVIAGVTVGLTVMPQGLAYATLAGLEPQVFQ